MNASQRTPEETKRIVSVLHRYERLERDIRQESLIITHKEKTEIKNRLKKAIDILNCQNVQVH